MKNEMNADAIASDALALAEMHDEDFATIYADLQSLPLSLDTSEKFYNVLLDKELLNGEGVAAGDFIVYVMYELASRGDKSLLQLFEPVVNSVRRDTSHHLEAGTFVQTLLRRIESLSQLRNIVTSIKAAILLTERERTFHASRVITDVRPVFEDSASTPSFLLLNTLALEYQENEKRTTLHIPLDLDDMDILIAQLERAKHKAEVIKGMCSQSNFLLIE